MPEALFQEPLYLMQIILKKKYEQLFSDK